MLFLVLKLYCPIRFDMWKCIVRKLGNLHCPSYLVHRTSRSEFVVSVNKYLEAKNHKMSVGMRFKMRFEGDESPERRYSTFYIP